MYIRNRIQTMITFLVLLQFFISVSLGIAQYFPPEMRFNPPDVEYITGSQPLVIKCQAKGYPEPNYTWKKWDGRKPEVYKTLEEDNDISISNGELTISRPSRREDGYYKCFATNPLGTAMSSPIQLITPDISSFGKLGVVSLTVDRGQAIVLKCRNRPKSTPPALSAWSIESNQQLPRSKRYIASSDGDLYIIAADVKDTLNTEKLAYQCTQYNPKSQARMYGSPTQLTVNDGPTRTRPPSIDYVTDSVDGKMGFNTSFTMQCIPGGNPIPDIMWRRNGKDIQSKPGRFVLEPDFSRTLTVRAIEETDEGKYECYIKQKPSIYRTVYATVVSKPIVDTKPTSQIVLTGSSPLFECIGRDANNHDPPTIEWYKNTQKLDPFRPPKKMIIEKTRLRITNVTKSDAVSLACRLYNKHGEVIEGFSLNVIENSNVVENNIFITNSSGKWETKMRGSTYIFPGSLIVMRVYVLMDPLIKKLSPNGESKVSYKWYRNSLLIDEVSPSSPIYLKPSRKEMVLNDSSNTPGRIDELYGNYSLVVSVPGIPAATVTIMAALVKMPAVVPVVATAAFPFWVIGLAIGVLLLILIVIMIVMLMYKNRGGVWKVAEKEKLAGNNVERELADSGFHELGRADGPDEEKKMMDQRSITDMDQAPDDDTASLDEYGEPDMTKFNEEGSFIDMYGKPKSKPRTRPDSNQYPNTFTAPLLQDDVTPPPRYSQYPESSASMNTSV